MKERNADYDDALAYVLGAHLDWIHGNPNGTQLAVQNANLRGAYLHSAQLDGAILGYSSFVGANLVFANFARTRLGRVTGLPPRITEDTLAYAEHANEIMPCTYDHEAGMVVEYGGA